MRWLNPGRQGAHAVFTVEFKQFGVQLAFTPTIIDANHLNLRVRPEVSQLDFANAVTVSGSLVPALTVRRAETTIDLASGQSFALAGLLMHNTSQDISKVPWLRGYPDTRRTCSARTSSRTTRPNSSSSSPPTWCSPAANGGPLRRRMDLRRRTMRSKYCLATLGGVAFRRQRAARSMPAGVV